MSMLYVIKIESLTSSAKETCELNQTISDYYTKVQNAEFIVNPLIAIGLQVGDVLDLSYDLHSKPETEKPPFWLRHSTIPYEGILGHSITIKKRTLTLKQVIIFHCEID